MDKGKEDYLKRQVCEKFYEVTNVKVAEELIKLNKYLYFTEEREHWKYKGKMQTVYYFEMFREIFTDVKVIKENLKNKRG
jgi:hypothetical protein